MKTIASILAATLPLLLLPASAPAYILIAREPVVNRVALADVIVVGRITVVHPGTVRARIYPRENNQASVFEFLRAEVEVSEVISGPRDLKRLTIACIKFQVDGGQYKPKPRVGLAGCFFAVKHFDEDFHVVPMGGYCDPATREVEAEMPLVRRCAELLAGPKKGLTSTDAGERLLTAHLLALRYNYAPLRWWALGVVGEKVDPEISRLLLLALARAEWGPPDPQTRVSAPVALNWMRAGARQARLPWPGDFPTVDDLNDPESAKKVKQWLLDRADTFPLQRLVPSKSIEIRPATRGTR